MLDPDELREQRRAAAAKPEQPAPTVHSRTRFPAHQKALCRHHYIVLQSTLCRVVPTGGAGWRAGEVHR